MTQGPQGLASCSRDLAPCMCMSISVEVRGDSRNGHCFLILGFGVGLSNFQFRDPEFKSRLEGWKDEFIRAYDSWAENSGRNVRRYLSTKFTDSVQSKEMGINGSELHLGLARSYGQ
jgi:hypothetical protein